jgi:hypothetical protein
VANLHERVTSWDLSSVPKSRMGVFTSYFSSPSHNDESQSTPLARAIADYHLPAVHSNITFPALTSSPLIKAAFTNQQNPSSRIECTAMAEVECSASTRGIVGIRGIRLFEYTLSSTFRLVDFGQCIPWIQTEIDLGMPRGEVKYIGADGSSSSARSLETPPSSEQESPELQPDNVIVKKKRRRHVVKDGRGIERDISASLGTELDKSNMVVVPPTPPGSFSTPKLQPTEWIGDMIDRGKTIVRNVRGRGTAVREGMQDEVSFEDGVEILSWNDAPAIDSVRLDRSESNESEGSGHGKVRGDGSVIGGDDETLEFST